MIAIHIVYDENQEILGFRSLGHAGYAESGYDIICSAVSALTINLINSTLELTNQGIIYESSEEQGLLRMKYDGPVCADAKLLFNACLLGLQEIKENYGKEYIKIIHVQRVSKKNYKIINHQEV